MKNVWMLNLQACNLKHNLYVQEGVYVKKTEASSGKLISYWTCDRA